MAQRLGLILTGGSLRGICAETAGLMLLEQRGYKFDVVIGASAGAIVGALYASGKSGKEIFELISGLRKQDYIDPDKSVLRALCRRLEGWHGLLKGEALLSWLRQHLPEHNRLEKTERKLFLAVTNVSRARGQVKEVGPLAELTRASAAQPFIYRMQEIDGEWYADGGIVNNIPIDDLAEREPKLDRLLVITSLRLNRDEPEPDNKFLTRDFTPVFMLDRFVRAVDWDLRAQSLESWGIPVQVIRPRIPDFGLREPQKIRGAIEAGIADLNQQLATGMLKIDPP